MHHYTLRKKLFSLKKNQINHNSLKLFKNITFIVIQMISIDFSNS